ncbi:helix-turn-helix domain-containing protein [Candidatus Uhrbacteria bacterium]|nr:helix-turn-helix domain-containing protein [Candidatus Uhrbacteria bacterium]
MGPPSGGQLGHEYDLLNVGDVASILRTSRNSVYRLIEARIVPFHRIRSGLRVQRSDVEAYLASCRVEAIQNEHPLCRQEN